MTRILIGIILLAVAAPGPAPAGSYTPTDREGLWEFTVQTRYTGSKGYDGEGGSSVDVSDDLGWGFSFGYNISNQFNLACAFTWRSMAYEATIVDAVDPRDISYYSDWLRISTVALQGEWVPLHSRVSPYATGAIGWTAIDTNIYAGSGYTCWWDPWWGYVCGTYPRTYGTDAASWSLGAGIRAELNRVIFLRVGYERGWVDTDSVDGSDMFRVDLGALLRN